MREILFRGKALSKHTLTKSENGWVFGVPVPIKIDAYMTDRVEITKCHGYDELDYYELLSEDDEVDPKTVGQFTGMLDKNGKKIFEGDIVKVCGHLDYVIFENGCFSMARQAYNYEFTYQDSATIEIIGNIHDNPELLEVK